MSRPWAQRSVIMLALASVLAAGCVRPEGGPPPAWAEPTPLAAGDTWTHESTMYVFDSDGKETWPGTTTVSVEGAADKDGWPAYELREGAKTEWLRQSDLALVAREREDSFHSEAVLEPCGTLEWPLEVGKEWTQSCDFEIRWPGRNGPEAVGHTETTTFRVLDHGRVVTPAGSFQAYKVERIQGDNEYIEWYAPTACNVPIKSDGKGTFDSEPAEWHTVLVSITCQSG